MKSTTLRRAAALSAGAALTLAGLATTAATAAPITPAPAGADPAPAKLGAAYLAAQPGADGIIVSHSEYMGTQYDTPSPGITIDAALSLDAVGGQAATVAKMAAGVEASSYPTGSAGSAAKFAAFEYALGRTSAALPTAVAKVNTAITTTGAREGRLENNPGGDDFESPLTQAYAVKALHDANASNAGAALDFLLQQQCPAGFFRSSFSPKASSAQGCDPADAAGSSPSVDYTAFAVLNLQSLKGTPAVATSLASATSWLAKTQGADGSYGGNANSTGLAGWALGISGQTGPAAKAASWLRAHQLVNAGGCTAFAPAVNGALVVDDLGLLNAKSGPMDINAQSTATYATSQALPALLWAPGGAAAGETKLTGPEFVKAGTSPAVSVTGAPGDTLCVTVGSTSNRVVLPANGATTVPLTLPATTSTLTVRTVDAGGEVDTLDVTGLAAAKLKGKAPRQVELGDKFRVKVTGLAPGESLVAKYRGKKVTDEANGKGVAKFKLKATKLGKAKVQLRGEFGNRSGKVAVTVTR